MDKPIYIGADAETYYDTKSGYSLASKSLTMQEYIEDARFESLMWAVGVVGKKVSWGLGRAEKLLNQVPWDNTILVAQNAQFDAGILDHHYGIRPRRVVCIMAMCRTLGIHKITGSVSLVTLTRFFGVGSKGHAVTNANGKHLKDFTKQELMEYREYNINDTSVQNKIFQIIKPYIKDEELIWNSTVNKMFTEPTVSLDKDRISMELKSIIARRNLQQDKLADMLGMDGAEEVKRHLGSNLKFASLLEEHGVEIPMKVSPTTGKDTYAFAKTDKEFNDLLEHPKEMVRTIVETRIGVKSNTEQKRAERLLLIATLPSDRFRIPHKISGAHTHRLSGVDGINCQNFPSGRIEGQSKELRCSIVLKDDKGNIVPKALTAPDSGQIEARILAFISNDVEMIDVFAKGQCPYSIMAEAVYMVNRDKIKSGDGAYKAGDESKKQMYLYRQTGKASVLQLGFGAGAKGFHSSLRDMYGVTGVNLEDATTIREVYHTNRPKVVEFWDTCRKVLKGLVKGKAGYFGGTDGKLFYYTSQHKIFNHTVPGILLPDGNWLTYPSLHKRDGYDMEGNPTGWTEFAYYKDLKKYNNARKKATNREELIEVEYKHGTRVWFGTIVENLCQALAFAVLKYQAIRISQRVPIAFNVHDEFIIGHKDATKYGAIAKKIMETSPPWLKGMQLECEYEVADNYGDT